MVIFGCSARTVSCSSWACSRRRDFLALLQVTPEPGQFSSCVQFGDCVEAGREILGGRAFAGFDLADYVVRDVDQGGKIFLCQAGLGPVIVEFRTKNASRRPGPVGIVWHVPHRSRVMTIRSGNWRANG